MIVIDASVALAWSYEDEQTEPVLAIFKSVATDGAIAPAIWPMEIANSVELAILKNRITAAYAEHLLGRLARLMIEIEDLSIERIWGPVFHLSHQHALTAYDAAYLELAIRRKLPLATLDKQLIAAARAEGVLVLP